MRPDGGPAFPIVGTTENVEVNEGISVLDYFATSIETWPPVEWLAARGYRRTDGGLVLEFLSQLAPDDMLRALAQWRYDNAIAMLNERQRRGIGR